MVAKKTILCKGKGISLGYGCGELIQQKYGLCRACLYEFYSTDERGKEIWEQELAKTSRKEEKQDIKEWNSRKKELRYTDNAWLKDKIQDNINKMIRFIDYGHPCLARNIGACGISDTQFHAGHIHSRGANASIAWNLHNIHRQSAQSNHWQSDDHKMRVGLVRVFGAAYAEFVENLTISPPLNLTNQELVVLKLKTDEIVLKMKTPTVNTISELVKKRNEINIKLGIYSDRLSVFDY